MVSCRENTTAARMVQAVPAEVGVASPPMEAARAALL